MDDHQQPHGDSRQWGSVGIVEPDPSPGQRSVRFDDDQGNPLPHGVLVDVKLQPSGVLVPCRVASQCAEAGGGEYHPFVAGDEVVVLIPEGDELAGGIIVGRLNQAYDVFPRVVAGEDVTQNNVAHKRLTCPYVIESGTSLKFVVASTGAGLTLDPQGRVVLVSGDQAALMMTPDAVSLQLAGLAAGLQLDPAKKQAALVAGGTSLVVDDQQSKWETAGQVSLNTGGNTATNHAVSIEAVCAMFQAYSEIIGGIIAGITGSGAAAGAAIELLATTGFGAVVAAAALAPPTPTTASAIKAALAIPKSFPNPGVGSPGTLID